MDRTAVARTLRNAPALASVLARHVGRSPAQAASVVLRAAPPLRRLATAAPVAARRPDLAALAVHAAGRREEAAALLRTALGTSPAAVAEAAVALHRPDLAAEALGSLPLDHPARARVEAALRAEEGGLDEAIAAAERGARSGGSLGRRSAAALARRLRGEREVLRAELLRERLPRPVPAELPLPASASVPSASLRTATVAVGSTPAGGSAWVRPGARPVVLHVVTNALPEVQAGYTIRTHGIVTAQRAAGWEPHVVTRLGFPVDVGRPTAAPEVVVDGVAYHRLLPAGPVPLPGRAAQERAVEAVAELARRTGAQLLHAHSRHDNAQVALLAAARLGLPVVYEVRGLIEETWRSRGGDPASDYYRWSREAETACMERAHQVVTLAATMREDVLARGLPGERVSVVGNAVPEDFLAPLPDRQEARASLGLPSEAFVLGTVTTMNDYEGLDTLVRALSLLPPDPARPAHLLLVGDGPARAALGALAAELGVADRVHLPGRVPHADVRRHLAALDVFTVPRRATPVTRLVPPIKPVEAMASGLPVLASDLPPLVELVVPGVGGEVVPPDDPVAWSRAVEALRYAGPRVGTLGAAARELVRRHRTWAAAVARYDEVYTRAAAPAAGTGSSPSTGEGA